MYKELEDDIGCVRKSPHLQDWAREGVLLLNTVLTVRQGEAHTHRDIGWETFTDEVIKTVSENLSNVVFILRGKPAQQKMKLIDTSKHHVNKSPHPSPLSAYLVCSGSTSYCLNNAYLQKNGIEHINWCESGL